MNWKSANVLLDTEELEPRETLGLLRAAGPETQMVL